MELNVSDEIRDGFEAVLRHCALEGAVRVGYSMVITPGGRKAALKYYDTEGRPIGDDRDYDVLKSCFGRLERLAAPLTERRIEVEHENIEVEHENNDITAGATAQELTPQELMIDLDLVSGQVSVSIV